VVKQIEQLEDVYKVKTLNLWEVEKGSEVASTHVVVKKGTDSNDIQEKIQKIVGTNE